MVSLFAVEFHLHFMILIDKIEARANLVLLTVFKSLLIFKFCRPQNKRILCFDSQ